ncbi:MAG: hypothetical protein RIR89_1225 [Actinomycetota bacterium]|jgi:hypothetical protein
MGFSVNRNAITLGLATVVAIVPAMAQAAEPEDVSQFLIEQASEFLNTELSTSTISEELESLIVEAIEVEVIEEEILVAAEEIIDSGDPIDLTELLDTNAEEQEELIEEAAPFWVEAMNQVKADFQACREISANARDCARGLGFKLQVAKETAVLTSLQERILAVDSLPIELQQEELAELEKLQLQSQAKIARASEKLGRFTSDPTVAEELAQQIDAATEIVNSAAADLAKKHEKANPSQSNSQSSQRPNSSPSPSPEQPLDEEKATDQDEEPSEQTGNGNSQSNSPDPGKPGNNQGSPNGNNGQGNGNPDSSNGNSSGNRGQGNGNN